MLVVLHSELLTVHCVAFHVACFWVGGGGIRDGEMRGWGGGPVPTVVLLVHPDLGGCAGGEWGSGEEMGGSVGGGGSGEHCEDRPTRQLQT